MINDQVTWVATSPYGLEFRNTATNAAGIEQDYSIEPVHLGSSYFRVFEYGGEMYALDNGGKFNRALDAANPWSIPSGHDFTTQLWDNNPKHVFQDAIPESSSELRVRHTGVRVVGDQLHVFYSRRGDIQERIQLSTIDLTEPNWENWAPKYPPYEILAPNPGWEGGDRDLEISVTSDQVNVNQLRDPDFFQDTDGKMYVIYSGNGEDGIGIARLYKKPTTNTTLTATEDTYVKQSTTLIGNKNSKIVTSTDSTQTDDRTVYIKFDLSGVTDIEHAVVRLYVSKVTATNEIYDAASKTTRTFIGGPVTAYKVSDNSWNETTMTASTAPALGDAITTNYIENDLQYYDWNITEFAKANEGSVISVAFDIAPTNLAASYEIGSLNEGSSNPAQLLIASRKTYAWNNAVATNGIFNVAANWLNGSTAEIPAGEEILTIDGNVGKTMTNNLVSTNRHQIIFGATNAASRTINGSTENTFSSYAAYKPKIENNASVKHTIAFPIKLGNYLELIPNSGDLTFTSTINTNGNIIEVLGNNNKTLTISGIVSGTGGLSILENSNVVLSGENTYSGATKVKAGTLKLQGSIAASDVTVESGATLYIDGANVSLKSLTVYTGGNVIVNSEKTLTVLNNLVNNGSITFESDASGSGMFGVYNGTISGTGTTTVERYIPAKRAYRFLTSTVTTSDYIFDNWQESGSSAAGFGTHITGGSSGGFDVTSTNNPSLFTFNHLTAQWVAVANTNATKLDAGTGYRLMVRGDRTIDLNTNTPTATETTLRATGDLYTGNFTPTLNQAAEGDSFIGNPYQAPIDIKAVLSDSTNININKSVVHYWDPTLNTRGGYVCLVLKYGYRLKMILS
jgi:autotransporter-associated beta strand protein